MVSLRFCWRRKYIENMRVCGAVTARVTPRGRACKHERLIEVAASVGRSHN